MASEFQIRHAATRDRRVFGEFDARVAGDLQRRELVDAAIAARRCWVAERDGRIQGYGVLTHNFFHRDFIELVYVTDAARRRGAASAILSAIERAVHADCVFTSTNESNAAMRALLHKS